MLSILICSIKPDLLDQLKENLKATIGVTYEVLVWNNRNNKKGICEVYNILAAKAKFSYLCFCHEDVLFKTKNWGTTLLKIFNSYNSSVLVGIAGSSYKSKAYSGWYTGQEAIDFYFITSLLTGKKKIIKYPVKWQQLNEKVVCIDGVFMACSKELWSNVKYNQEQLKDFHFYDLDFSLRAAQKYPVIVTEAIQLIHLSVKGDFGENWVREAFNFHNNIMEYDLPSSVVETNEDIESKIANVWLDRLKNEKISMKSRLKWIKDQQLQKKIIHWPYILKFFLYQPIGIGKILKFLKVNK